MGVFQKFIGLFKRRATATREVDMPLEVQSVHQPQILLMEDHLSLARALQMVLCEEGYGVDIATTGHSALSTLSHKDYDLLVADLRLPDMDGMQVIRLLKDGKPETGVIVITGYETVPSVVEAMKAGVADYLIKPFTEDTFIEAVGKVLKEKERLPALQGA